MAHHIDLTVPELAYLFGFLQADGHLSRQTRNRGRLSVEIQASDVALLHSFADAVPVYSSVGERTRDTNFKDGHKAVVWRLYDRQMRETLAALGLPYGPKSRRIAPPDRCSRRDYLRGLLDGDGSLGLTGAGWPFVSWCTTSGALAEFLLGYLEDITGKRKTANPNRRDGAYNIMVSKEDAQSVTANLYYPGCIALRRKADKAASVAAWERPPGMLRVTGRRSWTPGQDAFIQDHPIQESVEHLGRTERGVRTRLWRLRGESR